MNFSRHATGLCILAGCITVMAHRAHGDTPLTLAQDGRTEYAILLSEDAIASEQTAAAELSHYLQEITGVPFHIVTSRAPGARPVIAVGRQAAMQCGWTDRPLRDEEWIVATTGNDLILVGGRPRGTLYAAYHFLEDVLGVHWWTPWEETVPRQPRLQFKSLNLHGEPAFRYRDIYMLYGYDEGRFAARNRLNAEGDAAIAARFGGSLAYGPPYHVHTFELYFPPSEYFREHPEWYSLIDNQRLGERSQLCLTNPSLREAFLQKLRHYIQASREAAKATGAPPPRVFSVSQNDWANPCQCDTCQAQARAEGSEAGPLIDFVNFLAERIQPEYPDVFLDTLAYMYTQQAPKSLKCRDNIIVRLCDTQADMLKPITAPENQAFREHILSWANVCRNLRIWDYAVTYEQPIGMPLPTAHTFAEDFRFYADHHVEGVFTELEYPVLADMRDFKVWLMMKSLENPASDYGALSETFMKGYYGPAGAFVRDYLTALEDEARATASTSTCWQSAPSRLAYINLAFVQRAHHLFDQAEAAVRGDATLLQRVRSARLPLDRATLAAQPKLVREWLIHHTAQEPLPWDRQLVHDRALATLLARIEQCVPESQRATEAAAATAELESFVRMPAIVPLPAKFRELPAGTVHDFPPFTTRNYAQIVKVVEDSEAECGFTNRLDLTSPEVEHPERYQLPMPSGLYGSLSHKSAGGTPIRAEDVPGPGYHWYCLGTFPIDSDSYVYLFWSWIIQLDVDVVREASNPQQPFTVWARIKFEGPRFPHGGPGKTDAICVERIILIKTD